VQERRDETGVGERIEVLRQQERWWRNKRDDDDGDNDNGEKDNQKIKSRLPKHYTPLHLYIPTHHQDFIY
jgi:hypothetical protein